MRVLGLILVLAGALGIAYGQFTYKKKETVVDLGPIQANLTHDETVHVPPWVSGGALAVGVVLLVVGGPKRKGR